MATTVTEMDAKVQNGAAMDPMDAIKSMDAMLGGLNRLISRCMGCGELFDVQYAGQGYCDMSCNQDLADYRD